jgi:hypothetical protein
MRWRDNQQERTCPCSRLGGQAFPIPLIGEKKISDQRNERRKNGKDTSLCIVDE